MIRRGGPSGSPAGRHRPHREHAFVDRGHLGAVGRPRRTASAARVDRHQRLRREPLVVVQRGRRHRQDLVGAFAEALGHRRDAGDREAFAVGRPGRRARLRQRVVDLGDLAARHVDHRHLRDAPHAVDVEEGDPRAVRRPRRALRLRRQVGEAAAAARLHVADPELQVLAVLVGGVGQLRAVGRPRGLGVERGVLGQVHRLAADRHHVDVADRGKRDLLAVGRDHRVHDAEHLARRDRGEVALAPRVGRRRARHLQGRAELDRLRRAAVDAAFADLAVRDVVEVLGVGPRRAEGEHVLAAGDRLAADLVARRLGTAAAAAAAAAGGDVIDDLPAGAPRRRVHAPRGTRRLALGAVGDVHRPHRLAVVAGRGEGDLLVVGRPGRHVVVGGVLRQLAELPAPHVEGPDVVVAAERVAAVRREGDARAVVRPGRLAIVEGAPRQLVLVRSVRRDRPQVVAAVTVGEEGNPFAVGRERRLARVVEDVGDAGGGAAGGRQRPDAALQIDRERAAIRRDRHGHRRPFVHRDVDVRRRRHWRPLERDHETQHHDRSQLATHYGLPGERTGAYSSAWLRTSTDVFYEIVTRSRALQLLG